VVALALMMAFVGILALVSTMSASVVERTREIGVLRAIGARPRQIRGMILLEGFFVTALSLPLALAIAAHASVWVGDLVGQLSFALPLPADFCWSGAIAWSVGALGFAAAASLWPARAAQKRSVREALAHV
jgi:putative ABC transport system permease protein